MTTIERVVEVDVPINEAYEQWTRFSDFPRFMEGVAEVQRMDESHMHWRATVGGRQKEWDVEIVENVPNRSIAWRSINGPQYAGSVGFETLPDGRALVSYQVDYQPEGLVENMGEWLGLTIRRIERDLEHFKEFVENKVANESGFGDLGLRDTQETCVPPLTTGMPGAAIPTPDEYDNVARIRRPGSEHEAEHETGAERNVMDPVTSVSPSSTASPSPTSVPSPATSTVSSLMGDDKEPEPESAPMSSSKQTPGERTQERRQGDRRRKSNNGKTMPVSTGQALAGTEWRKMANGIERLFTRFMQRPYVGGSQWQKPWPIARWIPAVEATERDGKLVIYADVPGIKLEDLRIEIDDDLLTLRGERHEQRQDIDTRSFRSERTYGRFCRSIRLPPYVDAKSAEAVLRDGVLEISLPTPNRPQGRRIEVRNDPQSQ